MLLFFFCVCVFSMGYGVPKGFLGDLGGGGSKGSLVIQLSKLRCSCALPPAEAYHKS